MSKYEKAKIEVERENNIIKEDKNNNLLIKESINKYEQDIEIIKKKFKKSQIRYEF